MTTTTHLTGEQLAHVRDTLDAMRAAGPEHFNMDRWFVEGESLYSLKAYRRIRISDCGTSACLAGFAALTADATDTMPVYTMMGQTMPNDDDTEEMRAALAEWLGMSVGLPAHRDSGTLDPGPAYADDWFYVGCWPQWARDMLSDESPVGERERHAAEFKVVTQVMDDLVHGVRCNWWDDDLSAVEHADLADAQP